MGQTLTTHDSNYSGSHEVTQAEQPQFRHHLVPTAPTDLHMPFQSCGQKSPKQFLLSQQGPHNFNPNPTSEHTPVQPCVPT